jgi:hypothetical protein
MTIAPAGPTRTIDSLAVQTLRARLLGDVILPGDEQYDDARLTHILNYDRYPAIIVRAADAADVIRAVEFAQARDLPLAVRSGGHSVPGHSSVDGGIVVDLSRMKAISVDPERQTVWAQPGVTSAELFAATGPHGLVLTTGDTSSVGLGGLTLGGGIGWLVRKYGLTIDHLLSVEMVTADGRIVVASAEQNPELFWALRGGGGNFGVVTGFEFRLEPAATILGGALILPATPEVLRGYAAYTPQAPEGLTTIAFMMPSPPLPFVPEAWHGRLVVMIVAAWVGDVEEGQRALDPLRELAEPVADLIGPMPYDGLFQFTDLGAQPHAATVRSGYMSELSDEDIETMLLHYVTHPNPMGMVQLRGLGGAFARVPAGATAFAHRDKPLFLAIIALGGEERDRIWAETLWQQLEPRTSGVYVNFLADEGESRIRAAYPPATYARLAEVKRRYDPTNLFRLNQNIQPAE